MGSDKERVLERYPEAWLCRLDDIRKFRVTPHHLDALPILGEGDTQEQAWADAASVISGFDYLLSSNISMKEATQRLRMMRVARKEAIKNTRWKPSHDCP